MAHGRLPTRIIAEGHDPLGERVNTYQKLSTLKAILKALKPDEREELKQSPLKPVFELLNKPAWSDTFGILLLSRQLIVMKKKELWIVFAGAPIRMYIAC